MPVRKLTPCVNYRTMLRCTERRPATCMADVVVIHSQEDEMERFPTRRAEVGDCPSRSHSKGRTFMATTLFKLAGGLALLAATTFVQGQDIQERTIRFGHLNNTDHPT